MKAGLTIEELTTEVMRQKDAKADYIVNTSMLAMEHCGNHLSTTREQSPVVFLCS